MTKFLLDSGDPKEYMEIAELAKKQNSEIWGATTNPTLIAKTLTGKKLTQDEAFKLQKEIVMEILGIVPGAVSAEVYADESTTAEQMIKQGEEIATWDKRIYVKLPTTTEAFKARTALREKNIPINNTLVFSQQQIFAICLHEQIIQKTNTNGQNQWPPFISPFVGRIDDKGEKGMQLIENGMKIKELFLTEDKKPITWMLSSSIRKIEHIKQTIDTNSEIMTAPAKAYREWFALSKEQRETLDTITYLKNLKDIPYWEPPQKLEKITTIEKFMEEIQTNQLDIRHPLTDAGIIRFAADWKAILI
jgi:transaldolase